MVLVRPEDYSNDSQNTEYSAYKLKTPKRILHFSDGILEEYSSDEEDLIQKSGCPPNQEIINQSSMAWGPWLLFKTWAAGNSTLSFIDYLGETLASLFGITTPRYYFELEEYKRREANAAKHADQVNGWCKNTTEGNDPIESSQPKTEDV